MKRISILIVDDEEANCENLADILEDAGHEVFWTTDPEYALSTVKLSPPQRFDIALLDFKMPKINGDELLKQLRKNSPNIMSILITAYAESTEFDESNQDLFEVILKKPIDVDILLHCIENIAPIVLCVDDDLDFCDSLCEVFQQRGIRTVFVHNLKNAETEIKTNDFDVAILDIRLPDGNGLAAIQDLKSTNPEIGTIVITGHPDAIDESDQSPNSYNAVFQKPLNIEKLLAAIFKLNKQNLTGKSIEASDR